jgi:hypothetical protein
MILASCPSNTGFLCPYKSITIISLWLLQTVFVGSMQLGPLGPQAKKPWLFGFGAKAKAKPKIWPGMAFGLAWQHLRPKPGQKAKASTACFEGH